MTSSTDRERTLSGSESLLRWYKEELFPPARVEFYAIVDQYAAESARRIAVELGLAARLAEPRTLEGVLDEIRIVPKARPLVRRVVQILCSFGAGTADPSTGTVRLHASDPIFDLEALRTEGLGLEPRLAPAFAMADKVREQAVAFSKGAVQDNAVRAEVHIDFFLTCPIGRDSSVLNGGVVRHLVEELASPAAILELGAGTMSGAIAVLDALREGDLLSRVRSYHFTELNPFFVMNARKELPARYPEVEGFAFHFLNFDKPLKIQGVEAGSIDVIHGVNCVHCAKDLRFTLREVLDLLAPGGRLVITQFTRGADDRPLPFVDLICDPLASYWDVQLVPGTRPVHGLASVGLWRAALLDAGFERVDVFPEVETGLAWFSERYFLGSVVATKRG